MEEFLASYNLGDGRRVYIGALARETLIEAGADHLGFEGYFVFETIDGPLGGLEVLGKVSSIEAAYRLADLWAENVGRRAA